MNRRSRKFLLITISVSLNLLIFFLAVKIAENYLFLRHEKDKKISVVKLNSISLFNSGDSKLEYFFEPNPNNSEDYSTNQDLLNERFNYATEKGQSTFRIIAIGDSHTYGLYVETRKNYPELLENMLNDQVICGLYSKFEVINLGVPGYDLSYSYERFRRRGVKYKPDLVIWFVNPLCQSG